MSDLFASIPWASVLVGLPFVGGLIAYRVDEYAARRTLAIVVASVVLFISASVALGFVLSPSPSTIEDVSPALPYLGARWHLGIDELAAPFLALAALIVLLILIAAPRRELEGPMIPLVLLTEAAAIGVYTSLDLGCLTLFWIASLVPGALALRSATLAPGAASGTSLRIAPVRMSIAPGSAVEQPTSTSKPYRAYLAFLVLGAGPIIVAVAMIVSARAGAGIPLPFDLTDVRTPIEPGRQGALFVLLAAALVVRKAVFPFHSWLPVLSERGPVAITVLLIGTHLGAFLASRVILPLLPDASAHYFPWIADLALASALYGALVGLAQTDLRRMLGFVLTSQMGLVLVGVAEANRESLHGALLQMLALGLTSTGLLLLTAQLEARVGTTDVRKLGGTGKSFPFLAGSFFVMGLASIGFPGSLMFVSEDLLIHGLLGSHPIEAICLLLATVMNGITLVRGFYLAFLGAPRRAFGLTVPDLLPRERLVALTLTALLLATGFAPTPLLRLREGVVSRLAIEDSSHAPSAGRGAHP